MIVNERWEPVAEIDVLLIFRRQGLWMLLALAAILLLGGMFLADDFTEVVMAAYRDPAMIQTIHLSNQVLEVDWSIAGPLCAELDPSCAMSAFDQTANMYFAGAAYIYLTWIGAGLALGFMLAVLAFATSFLSSDFRSRRMMLVPDITSKDTRRGFEVLEGFFTFAIAGVFMLFAMGYLVTLQNVYLRTEYANVLLLIFPFIQPGAELGLDGAFSGIMKAVTGQLVVINPNIVAVTVLGLLFLFIMLAAVAITLRLTARRGLDSMQLALQSTSKDVKQNITRYLGSKGCSVKGARDALADFAFWPVRWLRVNRLFGWLAIATLSLLVVTLGAYLISAGLWAILRSIYSRFEKAMGGPPASRPPRQPAAHLPCIVMEPSPKRYASVMPPP